MRVLAPVDGSESSERALRFAVEFARRFGADLHVVHVTDAETEATEAIVADARRTLSDAGIGGDPEVSIEGSLGIRSANRVGEHLLELVEERGYDHVVMGHHEGGAVGRVFLGSAAETVLEANAVPVTVIP